MSTDMAVHFDFIGDLKRRYEVGIDIIYLFII